MLCLSTNQLNNSGTNIYLTLTRYGYQDQSLSNWNLDGNY